MSFYFLFRNTIQFLDLQNPRKIVWAHPPWRSVTTNMLCILKIAIAKLSKVLCNTEHFSVALNGSFDQIKSWYWHWCRYFCKKSCNNKRIYNLSSSPQNTRFLLGDAIISSEANLCSCCKKQKRSDGKDRNYKTMSTILSFILILYLE